MSGELKVLSLSIELVKNVYNKIKLLPELEKFALADQIRRSAVSIPSNIAEGSQKSSKDFKRFIDIARGSMQELKIQLILCKELYNINTIELQNEIDVISKMTYNLKLKLNTPMNEGGTPE